MGGAREGRNAGASRPSARPPAHRNRPPPPRPPARRPRHPTCALYEDPSKSVKLRAGSLADKLCTILKHLRRIKFSGVRYRQADRR